MIKKTITRFAISTGAALLLAGTSMAGGGGKECLVINDDCPVDTMKEYCLEDPSFCKIFDKSTLYKNEQNCLIQKVQILSRYHGQHHSTRLTFDGVNGGERTVGASFWEHRRFRHGIKVQFLNDFTFWNEWNSANDDELASGRFFDNIDEMGVKWAPTDDFYISAGKQKVKILQEWETSSKKILTVERSFITNEVIASTGKPWGITTGFKAFGIQHELGAWLAGANDRQRWPASNTRGGASYRGEAKLSDNTNLHFDYLFTNNSDGTVEGDAGNADRLELSPYNHVFSLGTETHWDLGDCGRKAGLVMDLVYGIDRTDRSGNNQFPNNNLNDGEDVFGFYIIPHYDITERLQIVGRYAFASEARMHRPQRAPFDEDPDGLSLLQQGGRPVLEDIHTFYLGFNYRLCGEHLKLLGGYEYLTGDVESSGSNDNGGVTGDTWMIGLRTYF